MGDHKRKQPHQDNEPAASWCRDPETQQFYQTIASICGAL